MSIVLKRDNRDYTYADYLAFPDEDRVEIIDGVVYDLSPAPLRQHQKISMYLSSKIFSFLENRSCEVYSAPFDVRLTEKEYDEIWEIKNVVQPDISVICDPSKLDDRGCKGAPDWIIEILSPSTAKNDMQLKFMLYEKYGVKEYWIVEPIDGIILVYKLDDDGKYNNSNRYVKDDVAQTIFEDLKIDLAEVFGVEREEKPVR